MPRIRDSSASLAALLRLSKSFLCTRKRFSPAFVHRSAPRRTKLRRRLEPRLGDCLPNAGKTRGLRKRSDFYSDLPSRIKPIGVFYAYAEILRALKVESFRPNYDFYGPQQSAAASDQPSNVGDLVVRSDSCLSDHRKTGTEQL